MSTSVALLLVVSVGLAMWAFSLHRESLSLAATLAGQRSEAARRAKEDSAQIAALRQNAEMFPRPELNVPIIDLDPREARRGTSGKALGVIHVPTGANLLTLILNVGARPSYPDYSIEIVNAGGSTIWSGRGLVRSAFDTFTMALPRRLAPAGRYSIRLFGLRGDRKLLVEEYHLSIQYQ